MTLEEYKNIMMQKLGIANNCEEVEQIIFSSIDSLKEKQLATSVIADYLAILKDSLKRLSPAGFDYLYWCNIRCAILHLKKLTTKLN